MKKSLGPSWNQPFLIFLIIISCCSLCNAAPLHETTDLEQYPGTCYYNYNHYNEGDKILTNEPCLNCTCHNQMLMCYLRVCPFTKPIGHDCIVEKREDQCCPIITCPDVPVELIAHNTTDSKNEVGFSEKFGCYIDTKFYPEGAQVPSNPHKPCELCYCIKNRTSCLMQECTLHVDGCTPIYNRGVCCPVRYDCEHDSIGGPYLEDSHTTVRPTEGFLLTTLPSIKDSSTCLYNDQKFADGAMIPDTKPCEHCYCMKGDIVCAVQDCAIPLDNAGQNCTFLPPTEDECCPKTYICQDNTEFNILDETPDILSQVNNLITTTALPDEGESSHPNLHETVSEEDVQLQEHIDDVPKLTTSKTTEVDSNADGTTTGAPGANIKYAQESEVSGLETTTELVGLDSQSEDGETHQTDRPIIEGSSQDSAVDSTTEFVHKIEDTDDMGDKLSTESAVEISENSQEQDTITTTDSAQSVYILPNEIIPIAIPGEGDCLYDNITYKNNTDVPKITACDEHCICLSSIIKCRKTECAIPLGSNCRPIDDGDESDSCCPTYKCDGELEEAVSQGEETATPGKIEEHFGTTVTSINTEEATASPTSTYIGDISNKKDEGNLEENQETGELHVESELPELTTISYVEDNENEDDGQHGEDHVQHGEDHVQQGEDHSQHGVDHVQHGEDHSQHGVDHVQHGEDHSEDGSGHEEEIEVESHTESILTETHTEAVNTEEHKVELESQKPIGDHNEEQVHTDDHVKTEDHKEEGEQELGEDHTEKTEEGVIPEVVPIDDHTEQQVHTQDHKEQDGEDHTETFTEDNKPGVEQGIEHPEDHTETIGEVEHSEDHKEDTEDHTETAHKTEDGEHITEIESHTAGTTETVDTLDTQHIDEEKPSIELESVDKESDLSSQTEVTTEFAHKVEIEDKDQPIEGDHVEVEIADTTDSVIPNEEGDLQQHHVEIAGTTDSIIPSKDSDLQQHQIEEETDIHQHIVEEEADIHHTDEENIPHSVEEVAKPQDVDTTEKVIEVDNKDEILIESNKDKEEGHTEATIDLVHEHIDSEHVPESTEIPAIIPLESDSHVTTSSPVENVEVTQSIDLEDQKKDTLDQEDEDLVLTDDKHHEIIKPAVIIDDNTSMVTEQFLGEHSTEAGTLSTESVLAIKDHDLDNASEGQELTTPQPDVEKELTTDELMSAVLDILKATEISPIDGQVVENEDVLHSDDKIDENVQEPVQEHGEQSGDGNAVKPIEDHTHESIDEHDVKPAVVDVEKPENGHAEKPEEGHVDKPVDGHVDKPEDGHMDKPAHGSMEVPVEGHVDKPAHGSMEVPVEGHVDKPAHGSMEVPVEGHVEDTTSENVEPPIHSHVDEPIDSQSHVEEPGHVGGVTDVHIDEQVVDKTEPSLLSVDDIDYTTETQLNKDKIDHPASEEDLIQQHVEEGQQIVPEDIIIHDPNTDKDHIFNMIIDSLEEKTTVQPSVTDSQQEIIKEESESAENLPDLQMIVEPTIASSDSSVPTEVVTENINVDDRISTVPVKHTEITGTIEHEVKDEDKVTPSQVDEHDHKHHKIPLIHETVGPRPTEPSPSEPHHHETVEGELVTPASSVPEEDTEVKLETATHSEDIHHETPESDNKTHETPEDSQTIDKDHETTDINVQVPESPEHEKEVIETIDATEKPALEDDQQEMVTDSIILVETASDSLIIPEENISEHSEEPHTEENIALVEKESEAPQGATEENVALVETEEEIPQSVTVAAEDATKQELLPESNIASSSGDETIKGELPESNTATSTDEETIKEQLPTVTSIVDETLIKQLPESNATSSIEESIQEELPESNTASSAAAEEDKKEELPESSTATLALGEESVKPELTDGSLSEGVQSSDDNEGASTDHPIYDILSTESSILEPLHPEVHTSSEDEKPHIEHGTLDQTTTVQTESEHSTTIKADIAEHQTESSLPVEEVTHKAEIPHEPIDDLSQSTPQLHESHNKTEEDKISEIPTPEDHDETSTAHSTVHATPETHPHHPETHHHHHPHHPASEEHINTEEDLGIHSTPSQSASSFGMGSFESHTEPSLGPLPGGHYASGDEEDYTEEEDPGAFEPGTCRYGGKLFVSAQQIPRDDPCDFCFCFRSDIICLQQSCPPPISGCHEEPIQGFCCPRYECPVSMGGVLNLTTTTTTTTTLPPHFMHRPSELVKRTGCYIGGQTFKVGEAIQSASGPCIQCSCGGDGQMKCEPKVCTPEPMLRQMIAVVASRRR